MFNFDFTNPAILFTGIIVLVLILSLPSESSGRLLLILIVGALLFYWYFEKQLPGTSQIASTHNSWKKLTYLKSDHQYRRIITQAKSIYKFSPPIYKLIMKQVNSFIQLSRAPYQQTKYEQALMLKKHILNNTASLLLSIPPQNDQAQLILETLQNNLDSLLQFDLHKLSKQVDKGLHGLTTVENHIYSVPADDTSCPTYSNHFSLH